MSYIFKKFLFLIGVATLFAGCFSNEVAKCSDDSVKELVGKIYSEQINGESANPMLAAISKNFPALSSLESIRAISYDKEVNNRGCKAVMHFEDGSTVDLSYSVQADEEDSSNIYVELDTSFLQGLIMSAMMKSHSEK